MLQKGNIKAIFVPQQHQIHTFPVTLTYDYKKMSNDIHNDTPLMFVLTDFSMDSIHHCVRELRSN